MLRRKALEEVGLLDEDYFMYGEDIDLSYRLLKAGWANWYVPVRVLHYKGESTQKSSFRYVHVFYEAMLIFFRKHFGHLSILLTFPVQLAIYTKASLALIPMVLRKIRRSLGFVDKTFKSDPLYIFYIASQHRKPCELLISERDFAQRYLTPIRQFLKTCLMYREPTDNILPLTCQAFHIMMFWVSFHNIVIQGQ